MTWYVAAWRNLPHTGIHSRISLRCIRRYSLGPVDREWRLDTSWHQRLHKCCQAKVKRERIRRWANNRLHSRRTGQRLPSRRSCSACALMNTPRRCNRFISTAPLRPLSRDFCAAVYQPPAQPQSFVWPLAHARSARCRLLLLLSCMSCWLACARSYPARHPLPGMSSAGCRCVEQCCAVAPLPLAVVSSQRRAGRACCLLHRGSLPHGQRKAGAVIDNVQASRQGSSRSTTCCRYSSVNWRKRLPGARLCMRAARRRLQPR